MNQKRYHDPMVLQPDSLFSPVGNCGTNQPEEVKKLQRMIMNAGYQQATGRELEINGKCAQDTTEALVWYQRLLNLSPSGLVGPTDSWFIAALKEMSPHWRPRQQNGPLHVREGQITFDAEGHDYLTVVEPFRPHRTPYFSRVLHWPGYSSGVTLGRGYDMGSRSRGEVYSTLRQAGLEEFKAVICSKAAGLKGHQAGQFVQVYGPMVGEISHQQQIRLFEIAYRIKRDETERSYLRNTKNQHEAIPWHSLNQKIRDVLVDIYYQGTTEAESLCLSAMDNDESKLIAHISANAHYMTFESSRNRIRYLK